MKEVTWSYIIKERESSLKTYVTHLTEHGSSTFLINIDEVEVNIIVRVTLHAHTHRDTHKKAQS